MVSKMTHKKIFTEFFTDEEREALQRRDAQGFISKYADYLFNHTWSDKEICNLVALQTMDVMVPHAWINTDVGDLHLHIWSVIMASTGANKSVGYNYHTKPIFKIVEKYLGINPMVDTEGSVEGLTTFMSQKVQRAVTTDDEGHESLVVGWKPPCGMKEGDYCSYGGLQLVEEISGEWAGMTNITSYQYKFNFFNIRLFDGYIEGRNTNARGHQERRDVYIVRTGLTQPDMAFLIFKEKNFKLQFFSSGNGPRYLYLFGPKIRLEEARHEESKSEVDQLRDEFARMLCCLYKYNVKEITKSEHIQMYLKALSIDLSRDIIGLQSDKDKTAPYLIGYLNRQKVNLYKLAALHCISRNMDDIVKKVSDLDMTEINRSVVNEHVYHEEVEYEFGDYFSDEGHPFELNMDDVNWAVGRVLFFFESFQNMLDAERDFVPTAAPVFDYSEHVEKVQYALMQSSTGVLNERGLMGKLLWPPKQFADVTIMMRKSGKLFYLPEEKVNPAVRKKYDVPRTGNRCALYSLVEFSENIEQEAP